MTTPRILSAGEIARRASHEAETLPHTVLLTHRPRHPEELGALPPRLSTFRPPALSLSGIVRDGGHPVRPAGRGPTHETARPHPSVEAPEGIVHFHPATPRDREELRRTARALLRVRPGSAPHGSAAPHAASAPVSSAEPAAYRPNLDDCRRHLSAFRGAMADFERAHYFGGSDRRAVASDALRRAHEAYDNLFATLPLTPSMSGILENLSGRMERSEALLAAIEPPRGRSRRRHA